VHVTVELRELVTDGESIPASATDIRPEHRQEIIAVMRGLAKQIHEEEQWRGGHEAGESDTEQENYDPMDE
jgi:hypothetical protein